jgi:hypothetical protein
MSHFLTIAIVDRTEPDPGKKAEELMLPYFEVDDNNPWPDAKCDGFAIGGRYDGAIWGKEQHYNLKPEEFQHRYGLDVVKSTDNIRPLSTLVPDLLPYAVITPDGKWYDQADKSSEEWLQEFGSILEQHSGKLGVAIDCHC